MSYYISKKPSNASKRVKLVIILALLLVAAVIAGLAISLPRLPVAGKSDTLVFSEICTKNETIIADNEGRYRDYVELYNGGEEINLKGYSITDGRGNSKPFGDMVLPKDSYYLIFLDKEIYAKIEEYLAKEEQYRKDLEDYKAGLLDKEPVAPIYPDVSGEKSTMGLLTFGPTSMTTRIYPGYSKFNMKIPEGVTEKTMEEVIQFGTSEVVQFVFICILDLENQQ